jgi:restriction system protein
MSLLTTTQPVDWRTLQCGVASILRECGFTVEIERIFKTVRGSVEVDVYAEEIVNGRTYSIASECKHWSSRVPQTVIHAFRTVVADLGVNVGYIVSRKGFQSGAFGASKSTNLKLLTVEFGDSHFLYCVNERVRSCECYKLS